MPLDASTVNRAQLRADLQADLQRVGEALHGKLSRAWLARDLDVPLGTLNAWLDGSRNPGDPAAVYRLMREALERRMGALRALAEDL
jgi:hypothetical protein